MKRYDRDYFDRWYRDPARRAARRRATRRKARLALAATELALGRDCESVLDVGCGEGDWREPLLAERPRLRYLGLDSSEYAIARHGRERNLRLARFADLAALRFDRAFDLIVCADVMHYLDPRELREGLSGFAELGHGIAYLETYCREDAIDGDTEGFIARPARWYRKLFAAAGLVPLGLQLWATPALAPRLTALEHG